MSTTEAAAPDEEGVSDDLAWARFAPRGREPSLPVGGVVVLHGADSRKESHYDFARACAAGGLAALAFDARGHGASGGRLDGRAIDDITVMADLLRAAGGVSRIGLRGSSMGGYLALVAAHAVQAAAVVAICPASAAMMAAALRAGRAGFPYDAQALPALLEGHDEVEAARRLEVPLLIQHAEGDEVVPIAHSRALHAAAPSSTLVAVPGGHHRSLQHDPERQAEAVGFLADALG